MEMSKITDTNVALDPVGVVFNITGKTVEEFVYSFLEKKGVQGVDTVKVAPIRKGRTEFVEVFVFMEKESPELTNNLRNVAPGLRNKLSLSTISPSKKIKDAIFPLTKDNNIHQSSGFLYFRLDIFNVLGIMLRADRRAHTLIINETKKLKKDLVISVIKMNRFVGEEDFTGADKYSMVMKRALED